MIYNLGSINADHFYDVPHIPAPGETLAATAYRLGLGGKGANQSIAAARAGAEVKHIGAIGVDGQWMMDKIALNGIDISGINQVNDPSGHAIISLAADGENVITLFAGANQMIADEWITEQLAGIGSDDWLMLQNETNGGIKAAQIAQSNGARVCYSAAPFEAKAVEETLPYIDLLVMNEVEHAEFTKSFGPQPQMVQLITLGAKGAKLLRPGNPEIHQPAPKVTVQDSTGAGDTFIGYFIAALSLGQSDRTALENATKAAALKVTKKGTADAIPDAEAVKKFASLF